MLSDRFRAAVEEGRPTRLPSCSTRTPPSAVPVLFKPYEGRSQVLRSWQRPSGCSASVASSATCTSSIGPRRRRRVPRVRHRGRRQAGRGVDKLTFDQESLITELKVLIRPASPSRSSGRGWPRSCPGSGSDFRADRSPTRIPWRRCRPTRLPPAVRVAVIGAVAVTPRVGDCRRRGRHHDRPGRNRPSKRAEGVPDRACRCDRRRAARRLRAATHSPRSSARASTSSRSGRPSNRGRTPTSRRRSSRTARPPTAPTRGSTSAPSASRTKRRCSSMW